MTMNATVKYNDDAEPYSIKVHEHTLRCAFTIDGSSAVLTSVEPDNSDKAVYADDLKYIMDYVESLPFVQGVTMDEYEDQE